MTLVADLEQIAVHPAPVEPSDRLWTRKEYHLLADKGFFDSQRVELIEGRIIEMPPQKVPHALALELVSRFLYRNFTAGFRVRIQMPFVASSGSELEPDALLVRGDPRDGSTEHPTTADLVVEIAETSLRHDRRKAILYAGSGVSEYWIVNLVDRTLEVHRDAVGTPTSMGYRTVQTLAASDAVRLVVNPSLELKVSDILP